jgi:purine-binding chemotaxis protein CheW
MELQLVIFELGAENYGVEISTVEGIIKMQDLTHIPHAPSFVEGVTNLRGAVLPVIDLRRRFELPVVERTRETRIVVTNMNDIKIGMIVDAVSEVLTISDALIEPTPPIVSNGKAEFIHGIVKLGERLVILLDLGRVLSDQEQGTLAALPAAV